MSIIPFLCPKCGKEILKTLTEPTDDKIPNNLNCFHCGYKITNNDVRNQALKITDKLVRDALRKAGK